MKNFESARNTAQQIIRGERSSIELVERSFERIKRFNPVINAIVTLDEESALSTAKQAEAQRGRDNLLPLHVLPVTIKDALETAGLRTTSSYPPSAEYVPFRDATVVARLKAAGHRAGGD